MSWEIAAKEFLFDGGWRDIYVFDVNVGEWQRVLDALREAGYELVYHRAGEVAALPAVAADAFPADGQADRMLSVKFAGVLANCHFFLRDEIEFDIDPREVQGQTQLDALLTFMRLLSDSTGKDAVLTPENCPRIVILRARPKQAAIDYEPFGGFRRDEKG